MPKPKRHPWFDKTNHPVLILEDIMTIDPGLGGTGWAYWDELSRPNKAIAPDKAGVIPPQHGDVYQRIYRIALLVSEEVKRRGVDRLVIEAQELWTSDETSMAATSSGRLFNLVMLVGGIITESLRCKRLNSTNICLVRPTTWKGQLSKRAIDNRIKRAIGKKYPDHIADAVGIGLDIQDKL